MNTETVRRRTTAHWIVIRTLFGEVSQERFPARSLTDMIENEDWYAALGAEGASL
jgi:hypothetical protein